MTELRLKAHNDGLSLKEVISRIIRFGLKATNEIQQSQKYRCPEFSLGNPRSYDFDRALNLAEQLESKEISRKLHLRK